MNPDTGTMTVGRAVMSGVRRAFTAFDQALDHDPLTRLHSAVKQLDREVADLRVAVEALEARSQGRADV